MLLHHLLMWVQSSEPIGKGQQIPPSWASSLPFPALPCSWKRVGATKPGLGFCNHCHGTKRQSQLWAGLWLLYRDQPPHEKWLSSAAASFQADAPWSLQTSLSAALDTEMISLTMPFLLFLQEAHFAQTGVLTNSVWTGNITSASQSSFHFL